MSHHLPACEPPSTWMIDDCSTPIGHFNSQTSVCRLDAVQGRTWLEGGTAQSGAMGVVGRERTTLFVNVEVGDDVDSFLLANSWTAPSWPQGGPERFPLNDSQWT